MSAERTRVGLLSRHQRVKRLASLDGRNGGRADKCTRLESGRPTRPGGSNPSRSACRCFDVCRCPPLFTNYLVDVYSRVSAFTLVPGALLSSLLSLAPLRCLAQPREEVRGHATKADWQTGAARGRHVRRRQQGRQSGRQRVPRSRATNGSVRRPRPHPTGALASDVPGPGVGARARSVGTYP